MRSRHLTVAVDTFCFGIFLFELVTGKSPSFQPMGADMTLRDLMLTCESPADWVDRQPKESSSWSRCRLHIFGTSHFLHCLIT
jgi:hypothetical protein